MATILVVDDHEDLLYLMTTCLTLKGYSVRTARSKSEFLDSLGALDPDLIILDVMLGQDNGRDLCKEIKSSRHKHIPILLYSAVSHLLDDFEECQADGILEKPFEINVLLQEVQGLISKAGEH
ncbi:response regulator transcription factor [Ferruginibacter sp. HRS2-29]|uniref:response regulator transcription factor n=1 Tax=Ferruginibacter sp. HRS2-29 TaxID=2487334 RepID=UPI0020CD3D36|nr:response regulator [Ferruginibacter sp. HRS2-29]MCP9753516.1 response regulator [Ferruginibacter sp. HRS2-29]